MPNPRYVYHYIYLNIRLQYTSEVGELFAKHNVANDNPNDITNQGKCKKGEKDNFVYVNQDYDGDNDEINFESAFNLGRFVLASPDDFAKLATQVPQQLTNILQQLSEAGCRRAKAAKKVLIKIGKFIYECVSYNMPNPINNYLIHLLYLR